MWLCEDAVSNLTLDSPRILSSPLSQNTINQFSPMYRCAEGPKVASCPGSYHADVRWKSGGAADAALFPQWCHFFSRGEPDDTHEHCCVPGPLTFSSQHPQERQSLTKVIFSQFQGYSCPPLHAQNLKEQDMHVFYWLRHNYLHLWLHKVWHKMITELSHP